MEDTPRMGTPINNEPTFVDQPEVFDQQVNHPRRHNKALAVLAAGSMALAGIGFANFKSGKSESATASARNEVTNLLTVNEIPKDINCVDIVQAQHGETVNIRNTVYVKPSIGALKGVINGNPSGPRLYSDALEAPLTNPNDAHASVSEIYKTICEDPLFGVTVANEFATMKVGDVSVANLNNWLKPYNFDASKPVNKIAQKASEFFPVQKRDAEGNVISISENSQSAENYQILAEKLITLLSRFQIEGRMKQATTFNYVLSGGGLTAGELPEVMLNPSQYNADAIVLTLNRKPEGCYLSIGFNVSDQRPEGFANCFVYNAQGQPVPVTPHVPYNPVNPTTTTTWIGPKDNPHPPVSGGSTTTIPSDKPGGPVPTTSTTTPPAPKETTTTIPAVSTTSTTAPAGGCGANCN